MNLKERKMLVEKYAKDLHRLQEAAEGAGSCYDSEKLGWAKGYIAGLSHVRDSIFALNPTNTKQTEK